MHELWSSASYEPSLLSLAFAFAPASITIVLAYALVMRGAPELRAWLLLHFVGILPYGLTMALSPSITSPSLAREMFEIAAACIPLGAAAGLGFHVALLGKRGAWRAFVAFAVAASIAWIVIGATTDLIIAQVRWQPAGFWYPTAGPLAWVALVTTLVVSLPGFIMMSRAAIGDPPSDERRQLRAALVANLVTYAGLSDVLLAYGIGVFPLGWLLSGIGSLLIMRAVVVEDLLRVRAVDVTAPRLVLHFAAAMLLGWAMLDLVATPTWWGATLVLALSFSGVRVSIATLGLVNRGARGREDTLDRLVGQLVARARAMHDDAEIARLAIDVVELGIGVRVDVRVAAASDWGWTAADGTRLADELAPDPLLVGWLVEQRGPVLAGDRDRVPEDLRDLLGALLARNGARAIVPVVSRDELLALVVVPVNARVRGRALAFVERAADRLGEAIVHARMARRARELAAVAREVELAATVQAQLLPRAGAREFGELAVVGSWVPATRCGGDFWGVYPLGEERVLVAIGDVTGHGVAPATITAAASAACDVAVRRDRAALDLADLVVAIDAAVRRVGGGALHMTCFAAIVDPPGRTIRYVSCGHTTPYVCRGVGAELELTALVARGNPLGGATQPAAKVQQRTLRPGDLVVWYTDGVIDAQDPSGAAFGDRRMQRLLKRLDFTELAPVDVHKIVAAAVAAHRAGRPRDDDETLVIAQWRPPMAASTEPARAASSS
jgi:serine phosphatase RsbU (regulator of sigma subunit)